MPWEDEMGQHISLSNKPGPKDIFVIKKRIQICIQEIMHDILLPGILYPNGEEHPSTSVIGDIIKNSKLRIVINNREHVCPISLLGREF